MIPAPKDEEIPIKKELIEPVDQNIEDLEVSLLSLLDDDISIPFEVATPSQPDYLFIEEDLSEPVKPIVTPTPRTPDLSTPRPQDPSTSRPQDLSYPETAGLKHTFRILLWASALVVVFALVKYLAFSPRPKLNKAEDSLEVLLPEAVPGEENAPLEMVKVKGDTLVMGDIGPFADDDEFPLITLPVPSFWISKTEITQQQWLMVFPANPAVNKDLQRPIENISFYEVIEYCNAKSLKDGYTPCYDYLDTEVICNFDADGYRLPTEAEWELAAKAGKRRDFYTYSGSEQADEIGWYNGNSDAQSHPVRQKKPNQLGIFDLSGNLYEWVWNWNAPYSYRIVDQFKGPAEGTDKVIRGGSWYHPESEMRVSNRSFAKPFQKSAYLGFRVVRSSSTE